MQHGEKIYYEHFNQRNIYCIISTVLLSMVGVTAIGSVTQALASSVTTSSSTTASTDSGNLSDLISQLWPDRTSDTNSDKDAQDDGQIDVSQLTPEQTQKMQQMIADHTIVKHNGNDTDITIMDSSIAGAYDAALNNRAFSENRSYSGKIHVNFHGAIKHGNMDIYIGKTVLTAMHAGWGAADLVKIIVEAAGENYVGAVKSMVGAISQTVKAGNTKTGIHFIVRHWTSIHKK